MRSNLSAIKLLGTEKNPQATSSRFSYMHLFGLSLLISFLGSLPPGTTNLLTVRLVGTGGLTVAFLFAIGCMMAELVYVAASVFLMDRILRFRIIYRLLQWVSAGVLVAFSAASFMAAAGWIPARSLVMENHSSPLIFGFLMMMINPVQFPFWMSWTTVLIQRRVLKVEGRRYLLYIFGAGLGSLIASACFILLGQFIVTGGLLTPGFFHGLLGVLFLVAGVVQIRKIFERRDAPRNSADAAA